jgi:hypothetical protein
VLTADNNLDEIISGVTGLFTGVPFANSHMVTLSTLLNSAKFDFLVEYIVYIRRSKIDFRSSQFVYSMKKKSWHAIGEVL